MDFNNAPFIDYLNAVDDLLETTFGIIANDTNMDFIASCQEEGVSPQECVNDL